MGRRPRGDGGLFFDNTSKRWVGRVTVDATQHEVSAVTKSKARRKMEDLCNHRKARGSPTSASERHSLNPFHTLRSALGCDRDDNRVRTWRRRQVDLVYLRAMPGQLTPPPDTPKKVRAAELVASGLGAVPVVGGVIDGVLSAVLAAPVERRQDEWRQDIYEAILELQDRGFSIDDLQGNDQFVSAVTEATRIALGTHIEQKLTWLKAALVSTGSTSAADDNDFWTRRYLRWVEELDPPHIDMMLFLRNPEERIGTPHWTEYLRNLHADPAEIEHVGFEELWAYSGHDSGDERHRLVIGDLSARNLIYADIIAAFRNEEYLTDRPSGIPDRGDEFLRWLDLV